VTALAKAALDWLAASQAWKFYDGGFAPPCKRDYAGTAKVWGPGATSLPALWFGSSRPHPSPHVDDVHAITSSYRPPLAVWHLANKNFRRPVEVLATKPAYQVFLPGGDDKPAYWETVYYGNHFYLGSTVCLGGDGDMSPFSLLAENPARGVDVVLAMPGLRHNLKVAGSQIGQHHNQVIYLARGGKEFSWQLPKSAERVSEGGVWFVRLHSTWLAFWPIGLQDWAPGSSPTRTTDKAKDDILVAKAAPGNDLTGFALIAADAKDFADFNAFKTAILREASLTASAKDQWTLKGPGGRTLAVRVRRLPDQSTVVPCPPNSSAPAGSAQQGNCTCVPGLFGAAHNCSVCLPNFFCPGATAEPSPCTANSSTRGRAAADDAEDCECDAGLYRAYSDDSFADSECRVCPANSFCYGEARVLCPANSSAPRGSRCRRAIHSGLPTSSSSASQPGSLPAALRR
jgi:hypothetical protein